MKETPFSQNKHYYHNTIRNYTAVFGWLFSDFYIKRTSARSNTVQTIHVPITYGRGNAYERIPQDRESREKNKVQILPAFAYEIDGFVKDDTRSMNRHNRIQHSAINADGTRNVELNRVPYNFTFNLYARVKNLDDGLQIVEQILPVFNPTLTVKLRDVLNTEIDVEQDITIVLDSISSEEVGGTGEESYMIEYTFTFTLKGYLYGRTVAIPTINEINIHGIVEGHEYVMATVTGNNAALKDNAKLNDVINDFPTNRTMTDIAEFDKTKKKYDKRKGQNK